MRLFTKIGYKIV